MTWLGEKTEFHFDEVRDETGEVGHVVVEVVTSFWTVPQSVRRLCDALAAARGSTDAQAADGELLVFLSGERELLPGLARVCHVDLDPDTVNDRLRRLIVESENPFTAQAYVLDRALDRWGWFLGDVTFTTEPRPGVKVTRSVPVDAEELVQCLTPWLQNLPVEAQDTFMAAVAAAAELDGSKCRALCEQAAATLPTFRVEG